MSESLPNELEILAQAIKTEQDGIEFYLKSAETTEDKKGQDVFRQLARDEKNHLELLQRQYNSLKNDKKWTRFPEIGKIMSKQDSPLFPKGKEAFEKAVTQKSNDIDAILFGLDIENRSFELYNTSASGSADAVGKDMFEFLAGEEREHFNLLMMRYQYLTGHPGY